MTSFLLNMQKKARKQIPRFLGILYFYLRCLQAAIARQNIPKIAAQVAGSGMAEYFTYKPSSRTSNTALFIP